MRFPAILRSRRFLPLLLTQFLGAFNDNFFKTAVVIVVTYRVSDEWHIDAQKLVSFTGALFIFPYLLFCATAGKLADKYDKAFLARVIKLAEVVFMLMGVVGFCYHLVGFLFLVLFCMGTHSAFFSPVKYSLLPDHLRDRELMQGNAFIESTTFIATLLGTIAGGLLVLRAHGEAIVSTGIVAIALLGVVASRFIPPATSRDPTVRVRFNLLAETLDILSYVFRRRELLKAILANSWFSFVCITFLLLSPAFIKQILGADEDVVTLFLTIFSVGLGAGAVGCGLVLNGKVTTRYVPWCAVAISLFAFDLYFASPHGSGHVFGHLEPIGAFLHEASNWRMLIDLFFIALFGGFYIVPLYSVIQHLSEPHRCAQVMACNNVVNGAFMVASSLMSLVFFAFRLSVADVFMAAALLNAAVAGLMFTPRGRLAESGR